MSRTVAHMSTTEIASVDVQEDPQPWRSRQDRQGWHSMPRTRRRPGEPPVGRAYLIKLSREQARWLEQAAATAGIPPDAYLAKLVDDARQLSE